MTELFGGRLLNEVDLTEGREVLVHFIKSNNHKECDELQKQVAVVKKYCDDNPIKRSMTLAAIGREYTGSFTLMNTQWMTPERNGRTISTLRLTFVDDDGCLVSVQSKKKSMTSLPVWSRVKLSILVKKILTTYRRGEKEFITVGVNPTITHEV